MHVERQERSVCAYGDDPVPVVVTEDPEGGHWGWLGRRLPGEEEPIPTMVQPHRGIFDMQFAYGARAEVDAGRGEIIRLRVQDLPAGADAAGGIDGR